MSEGRTEGAMVFDEATGRFLYRVDVPRRRLRAEEYTMDDSGVFRFSSRVKGHRIQIHYHLVGPRVSYLNKRKRMRA